MLRNVHVKNLALIEEAELNLCDAFNILTGETGAGKSIVIDSITLCLGGKADKDFIREGAEYGLVELIFTSDDKNVLNYANSNDIPIEEDNTFILSRRIMTGRSIYKVNGEAVTGKQMKELASYLIDIHGQHEHQSLLSEKKQKALLDGFAGEEFSKLCEKEAALFKELKDIATEISSFTMDSEKREREIALAKYEVEEIERAELKVGELEGLEKAQHKAQNSQKVWASLSNAMGYLSVDSERESILDLMGYCLKEMNDAALLSEELNDIASHFADAEQVMQDSYRELKRYMDSYEYDEAAYAEMMERLDVINRLVLKYGKDEQSILDYHDEKLAELEKLTDIDQYLEKLNKKKTKVLEEYLNYANIIHECREKEAKRLANDIVSVLRELNFLKVEFDIKVNKAEFDNVQECNELLPGMGADGMDEVCFEISLNPGEKLKPISQVASGGELSRIMLALKTVLAQRDNIETLIFDEIDTGISGVTAWQVAKRMGQLAKTRQLICITHLPQIAAMGDSHFKIEKSEKEGKTKTEITILDKEKREKEVARLLGGEHINEASLANAVSLIEEAKREKNI